MERKITTSLPPDISKAALNRVLQWFDKLDIKCDYQEITKEGKQIYILDFIATSSVTESDICAIGMGIAAKIISPF